MEKLLARSHLSAGYYFAVAILAVVIISWLGFLDITSADYIDGSIVQASVAFASARALNAVVSVVQSTEVSAVVVSLGLGQALDPLNDLVEQYSTLMQYAIASLFIQKLLLTITSNVVFKILLTAAAGFVIGATFWREGKYLLATTKAFIFLAFLRFSLVLVVILNGLVNQFFINAQIEQDVGSIQAVSEEVQDASKEQQVDPALKSMLEGQLQTLSEQRNLMLAEKDHLNSQLSAKKKELERAEEDLRAVEEKLDLTKKINIFNRDAGHVQAIEKRDLVADEVGELEDQLSELNRAMKNNEKERIAAQNTLEGKANGMLEALGDATSDMAGGVKEKFTGKITALVDTLNESVTNMLNLMAAFLLKTLILPLLFLYMLVLVTKALWNIDLKDYDPIRGKKQKQEGKEMTA